MNKQRKKIAIIVLIFFTLIILTKTVFAYNNTNTFGVVEYTEEFKRWIELPEEEKNKIMQPRMYDNVTNYSIPNNIIYKARMLGASINPTFSLKSIIPSNLIIKDQGTTQSCWAFAAISSLETNLAVADYKKGATTKVYDYSERHMEYANSRFFANNVENELGYNRNVGDGGNWIFAESYLTNGFGAINESEMQFEDNENIIDINQIRNKVVSSQVYDTVDFPDYSSQSGTEKEETMNAIKQHIQNYGSVFAAIHGDSSSLSCYNDETSAKYCNNTRLHSADHGVSIIGWNDNFEIDNFAEGAKPSSKGAWIIRNSWGEETGDNGLIYVSYEDCNISKTLFGIIKADDKVNYENIYQYDYYFPIGMVSYTKSQTAICNIFNKKTTGTEYLTQVSLYAPETYECKVYVNPNGTSKTASNMQFVKLKAGDSETINAGYHTLEFDKPVKITGNQFTVAVTIEGTRSGIIYIPVESKTEDTEIFDNVTVETGKCFIGTTSNLEECQWMDLGTLSSQGAVDGDSTLKAFTVSEVYTEELTGIEIVTPPDKTTYYEGENFDKTGMVLKANYDSKNNPSVILDESSYSITNGTNLGKNQSSVTIQFEDKTVDQPITVEANTLMGISIKHPPTKTEYKEGQNFDNSGMEVEAEYKNGNRVTIDDYTIVNGNNLKAGQTRVTISYGGKTVDQSINVTPNRLLEISITKTPNKTSYIVGQDFDSRGMKVEGKYEDNSQVEILDYTIENGTNLTLDQTSVTVKYGGKTAEQPITVEEKSVKKISIKQMPTKTQYIQNQEGLDLSGGVLRILYNDNMEEELDLISNLITTSGFNNTVVGKNTITVEYESKTTTFDVDIIKDPSTQETGHDTEPINSNFDNGTCNIDRAQYHIYTDENKNEYFIFDITINDISINKDNDKNEYYYYLSQNKDEENITDWIKVTNVDYNENVLHFRIDTNDINNIEEIVKADNLYIYIKEVAIKGGNQSIKTSKAIEMKTDANLEIYVNDEKVDEWPVTADPTSNNNNNTNSGEKNSNTDNTIATGIIPQTGTKNILIILIGITLIGVIFYIRYRHLNNLIK